MPTSTVGHSAKSKAPPHTTSRVGRSARPKVITSSGTLQKVVPASGCTEKGGHTDDLFQQCNAGDLTEPETEFSPEGSIESTPVGSLPEVAYDELLSRLAVSRLTLMEAASEVPMDEHMARPVPNVSEQKWFGLGLGAKDTETCCELESNEHLGQVLEEHVGTPCALESLDPSVLEVKGDNSSEESIQNSLQRLLAWFDTDTSHSQVHQFQQASKVPMDKQMAMPVAHDASVGETHCQLESEEHLGQVLQERDVAVPALTSLVPSVREADEKEDTLDDGSQSEMSRATTRLELLSEFSSTTIAPTDEDMDESLPDDAPGLEIRGPPPLKEHFGQELQGCLGEASAPKNLVPSVFEMDREDTLEESTKGRLIAWLNANHLQVGVAMSARKNTSSHMLAMAAS